MAEVGIGRRERRNQQTRAAIIRAGCELVLERGYEGTTMTEIADRADVARRTVHGWFSSKEEIVLGPLHEPVDRLIAELRDGAGDPVERISRFMLAEGARAGEDELLRLRVTAATSDPQLRALERERLERSEAAIAEAVAADYGLSRDSLAAQAWAAAALKVLLRLRSGLVDTDPARLDAIAAEGLAFLRAALAALPAPQTGQL